jgi:hypothetical protein
MITCSRTVRISCSTLNKIIQKDEIWKGHHNGCMITCSRTVRISCSLFRVEHEILTVPEHVILHPLWCPSHISSPCIVLLRVKQEILTVPEHVILHPLWWDEIWKGHHNGCKITCSGAVRISCSTLNKTMQKDEIWKGHHNGCKITCSGTVRKHEILTVPEHVIVHPLWCPSHISSPCIVLFRVEHEILSVPKHVILHPLWCPLQISSFRIVLRTSQRMYDYVLRNS